MPMKLVIPANDDFWDPVNERFVKVKEQTLILEHSLISLTKWEQQTKKPFISTEKDANDWLLYVKCMTINQVNELAYSLITTEMFSKIFEYINDPMTATTINNAKPQTGMREIITSELIYYNMLTYGIPVEFEKWHLNSLMMLLQVFKIKSGDVQKMSPMEAAMYQKAINEGRIAKRQEEVTYGFH